MSTERDQKVDALKAAITELATELRDKSDLPLDRITAIQAEITTKSSEIDDLLTEEKTEALESQLADLQTKFASFTRQSAQGKAAAILAGVSDTPNPSTKSVGRYNETNFLSALIGQRSGDTDAQEFVKAVLGTSSATGSTSSTAARARAWTSPTR